MREANEPIECIVRIPANSLENEQEIARWKRFVMPSPPAKLSLQRPYIFLKAMRRFPASRLLYLNGEAGKPWALYFCYLTHGDFGDEYRFTIDRLKRDGFNVLVVFAAEDDSLKDTISDAGVDGVIWKHPKGYDFSAYTIGLNALVDKFGELDVLVLNDSVLGPFCNMMDIVKTTPWTLTGILSSYIVDNHIISFSFIIKALDRTFMNKLSSVFLKHISFDTQGPVSYLQETRLARVASRHYATGSLFAPVSSSDEIYFLMGNPQGLLEAGFPFLKKSIFQKFSHIFDQKYYRDLLSKLNHPPL